MLDDKRVWAEVSRAFDRIEPLSSIDRERELASLDETVAISVRRLLDGADEADRADRLSGAGPAAGISASIAEGERIGPFTVERLIGHGGMGEVYAARRTDPAFDQRVALKLLRSDAVRNNALFERERRVLARLEHPGIARLVDGGVTPEGRLWMAMAYVPGLPLDLWCEMHRPSLEARLRLFDAICEAVSFAHANLVVHRDLKPSNIFVDDHGRVQLLDFGIAKLADETGDQTIATAMMTPEYAAPEQLENRAITVATDIHALGLILTLLLAGVTQWRGSGGALPVLMRRVLDDEPTPPSRLANRPDAPVPAVRLRGDLDAITLKALRKDPADRYATVREMAEDLHRFAETRPVLARVGSRRYRLGRYLRRNRWGVASAAAILLALVIAAGGIALQARRTAIERDNALAEARRSDAIVQNLTLMVSQGGVSGSLTLQQALDQSAQRMLATLDRSARSGAAVAALSDLYVNMQDAKGSYTFLKAALARGIGADDPVATARLKADLADAAVATGGKDDVEALLDQAQRAFESNPTRNGAAIQQIIGTRAGIARRKGDYDTAISLLKDSLPAAEHALAANDSEMLTRYNNLLVYLVEANRLADAEPVFAHADRILAHPGQRDTMQAMGIDQVRGAWRLRRGDAAGAENVSRSIVERRRHLFGETPGLATDLYQLSKAQIAEGRFADARASLREARPLAVRFLGPEAIPVVLIDLALAQADAELGDIAAATDEMAHAKTAIAALPPSKPLAAQSALAEAVVAIRQGRKAEAAQLAAAAHAAFQAMGSSGAAGTLPLQKIDARIAAMR